MVTAACGAIAVGSGCVETAECNESVTCPDDEVCYEYRCLGRCQSNDQCGEDEECRPCKAPDQSDGEGKCFGADQSACVPE